MYNSATTHVLLGIFAVAVVSFSTRVPLKQEPYLTHLYILSVEQNAWHIVNDKC